MTSISNIVYVFFKELTLSYPLGFSQNRISDIFPHISRARSYITEYLCSEVSSCKIFIKLDFHIGEIINFIELRIALYANLTIYFDMNDKLREGYFCEDC